MADLDALKKKYGAVIDYGQKRGVSWKNVHLEKEKLLIRGAAPNDAVKNEVWIKIKDIERVQRWRDAVEVKWWESAVVVLLFISGLGFIITIFKLIPRDNAPLFWFVFFWFLLFVLTLVAAVELVITKINALRALHELHSRMLEEIARGAAAGGDTKHDAAQAQKPDARE